MCIQEYTKCRHVKCDGTAELKTFYPCGDQPNCEIQYFRITRPRSAEPYCPECRGKDPKERSRENTRAWRKRTGYKSGDAAKRKVAAAAAATVGGSSPMAVEQGAGSSTAVGQEHRGAFGARQDTGFVSYDADDDMTEGPDSSYEPTDDPADVQGHGGPSSPLPIDPALLHIDTILSSGPDRAANMRDAQQYLRDIRAKPESSDLKKPSKHEGKK